MHAATLNTMAPETRAGAPLLACCSLRARLLAHGTCQLYGLAKASLRHCPVVRDLCLHSGGTRLSALSLELQCCSVQWSVRRLYALRS